MSENAGIPVPEKIASQAIVVDDTVAERK